MGVEISGVAIVGFGNERAEIGRMRLLWKWGDGTVLRGKELVWNWKEMM